jgi:arylsulfatase A-like enzyme
MPGPACASPGPSEKKPNCAMTIAIENGTKCLAILLLFITFLESARADVTPENLPNVLFIIVDDLNDWVEPLGGHPDARTPALNELASRGVVFTAAYCAAPSCGPARTALFTGIRTSTSGVYYNDSVPSDSEAVKRATSFPGFLRKHGYRTLLAGKAYAGLSESKTWDEVFKPTKSAPEGQNLASLNYREHIDWGPIDLPREEMQDWETSEWVSRQLQIEHDRPFLLVCGLSAPHMPWYIPRPYFEQFPLKDVHLPVVSPEDRDDLNARAQEIIETDKTFRKIQEANAWKTGVQSYLASIAFLDDCVGHILKSLDSSPHLDNTIVIFVSDQGFQMGEKHHWRKWTLWRDANRIPLIIKVPSVTEGGRCDSAVNQIDIYPTLVELCSQTQPDWLEGESLVPQLKNPSKAKAGPSITTFLKGEHALRIENWSYIRYADGSEELYDLHKDPHEWNNLATLDSSEKILENLRTLLPDVDAEPVKRARRSFFGFERVWYFASRLPGIWLLLALGLGLTLIRRWRKSVVA